MTTKDTDDQDTAKINPPYVCESFAATQTDEPRMQQWLNAQARRGYRLADRQVLDSGGASKRIHCVMERRFVAEATGGEA